MVTKKLTTTQRAGALAITGGLCTSPTDTLDALANLLPFEHVIKKWCYRPALHLATLPEMHPLQKPVKSSTKSAVKRHRFPLHNLLSILNIDISNLGEKPVATANPAKPRLLPFKTRIPPDKENSIKEAQATTEEIQVFTDGLITDNKVGAATILTRPGKDHQILLFHLGKASEYTIYDMELAGISMGMHLIKTEKAARHGTMLGADNQSAINAIQNELCTLTHYIAKDILQTARQISKTRGNKNYALMLRWTAGHMGINRNKLADIEAKKVAKGQSSISPDLARILHRKLKVVQQLSCMLTEHVDNWEC
jgi:ribonuclease HI